MKYLFYSVVGWCLVCGFAGEALAYDGNSLLEDCEGKTATDAYGSGIAFGFCLGFVIGVHDSHAIWSQVTGKQYYCLPESVDPKQMIKVVEKYLEDNPAELHKHASLSQMKAFSEAFPCPEGEQQ